MCQDWIRLGRPWHWRRSNRNGCADARGGVGVEVTRVRPRDDVIVKRGMPLLRAFGTATAAATVNVSVGRGAGQDDSKSCGKRLEGALWRDNYVRKPSQDRPFRARASRCHI